MVEEAGTFQAHFAFYPIAAMQNEVMILAVNVRI